MMPEGSELSRWQCQADPVSWVNIRKYSNFDLNLLGASKNRIVDQGEEETVTCDCLLRKYCYKIFEGPLEGLEKPL